ncbi:hypothetical protein BsWGS_25781 [Bradybaena similaris]
MARLYIYLAVLGIIAIVLTPRSQACSCGQICERFQSESKCRCCHYYQVGGKRSVDVSPEHHQQHSDIDAQERLSLNFVEELFDEDNDAQEKPVSLLISQHIQRPFGYHVPVSKNVLKSRRAEQERLWPEKTWSEDIPYFMPDFATRTSGYSQLPWGLVQQMTRKR